MIGHRCHRRLLQHVEALESTQILHQARRQTMRHRNLRAMEPGVFLRLRRYPSRHAENQTCHARSGVDLKKSLDEGLGFRRNGRPVATRVGNLQLPLDRLRGVRELRRQRVAAGEQEVGDDAERPHVAGLAVAAALVVLQVDLGSDVVARAHETVRVVRVVHQLAETEVDQLDLGVWRRVGEHDVAQLEVAMGDVLVVMEIRDGVQNLSDNLAGVVFGKFVLCGERKRVKPPGCAINRSNSSPPERSSITK